MATNSTGRKPNHTSAPAYWDSIARSDAVPMWRVHSDRANRALLKQSLGSRARARVALKTDLFDEAWSGGFIETIGDHVQEAVVGVDVSHRVVAEAKRRHPALVAVVADLRALPFRDGSFDLVVSPSTMDHFETSEEIGLALNELNRTMIPDGALIATLDNPRNPVVAVRNHAVRFWMKAGLVPYFVGATLGRVEFREAVERAGFSKVQMGSSQHCPRLLLVALDKLGLGQPPLRRVWLRMAHLLERLGGLSTRFLTAQFVVATGRKDST